ncbi:14368_t:CDS:1, partial [Entrophospora sp. SA101]
SQPEQINMFICENLPFSDQCSDPILLTALDTLNFDVVDSSSN